MIHTARHRISTKGQRDAHDVTAIAAAAVGASGQRSGTATVFVVGSTAVITTIEFEPGAIADLNDVLESLAPRDGELRAPRTLGRRQRIEPRPCRAARSVGHHPVRRGRARARHVAADHAARVRHASAHAGDRRAGDWRVAQDQDESADRVMGTKVERVAV